MYKLNSLFVSLICLLKINNNMKRKVWWNQVAAVFVLNFTIHFIFKPYDSSSFQYDVCVKIDGIKSCIIFLL